MALAHLMAIALLVVSNGQCDADTDGDGLADFHEVHRYFTDPARADSDADGIPDGDWNERREYAYSVRVVTQVLRPVTPDVFCDDYQDARILDETDDYVELEAIIYPLNTVADALSADPNWRSTKAHSAEMDAWTRPGLTANWDESMRDKIVDHLKREGIEPDALDDRGLVERASKCLLAHAKYEDGFSTFCSRFVNGKAEIHPGIDVAARDGTEAGRLKVERQWERELFARGMFEHGVRGSCTSTAIYLNGCLKALGIPTRIVLGIPIIDASDAREHEFVKRLRHHGVRRIVERGTAHLGNSWASHTFNEVFVGGRWRRLNFDRLGQNVLDPQMFGLLVHVATFKDWADGDMASTWGLRQSTKDRTNDPLGGSNPYSAITLSDRFGEHANIDNPPPPDAYTKLTIDAAWWFDQCPAEVKMRLDDPDSAGHVVVRVAEGRAGEGPQQYKEFYDRVGKKFVLKAKGKPDIPIRADRGYWAKPEEGLRHFYLRIEPKDFERMAVNVPYALKAVGKKDQTHRWAVKKGVTLTRRKGGTAVAKATRKKEAPEADGVPDEITIDEIAWSDGPDSPTGPLEGQSRPVLLLRVGKQSEFDAFKRFSELADRRFFLEADGHPTLKVGAVIGGVTTPEHSYAIIELGPADWNDLVEGVEYTLRPQNSNADHRWRLAGRPRVRR